MGKARKFNRARKSTSKNTSIKVSNKNYNRQLRAGKAKPKAFNKFVKRNASEKNLHDSEAVDDILDDHVFGNISDLALKRKYEDMDNAVDDIKDYERVPRRNSKKRKVKHLLPLKGQCGLIPQEVEIQETPPQLFSDNFISPNSIESIVQPEENLSFVQLCAAREKKLSEFKERIGLLCSSVVENPEENIRKVKDILLFLDESDPDLFLSVRRIAAISLVEVFKDVIPSYRIRDISNKGRGQKMKKETKMLKEYEESLLRYYKQFLCKLEKMLGCLNRKQRNSLAEPFSEAKSKARYSLAVLAVSCFAELLVAHPHFNFRSNILKVLIERLAHKSLDVSAICCQTVAKLFKGDKVGETSLETVKQIKKLVKSRNFNVPPAVLETFLSLNVRDAERSSDGQTTEKKLNKVRGQIQTLSRKEKKQHKRLQEVENELLEAEAEESKAKKSKFQTEILNHVFLIYFQILKGKNNQTVLAPVLQGLSKFSHLINVEYFDDLITVLYKLIETGTLGHREILHCLLSVFNILSGQGESLNIDPQGFYAYLYQCLLHLNIQTPEEDVLLFLQCLDLMIMQRKKKITVNRIFAFLKRLSTISLCQKSHVTLALMTVIRQYLLNFKQCDILLDPENVSRGHYKPELDDPEYCCANSSVLWELHQLVRNHHPVVAKYAKHLLMNCPSKGPGQVHSFLALKTPVEVLQQFNEDRRMISFTSSLATNKQTNSKHFHPCVTDSNSVTSQGISLVNLP